MSEHFPFRSSESPTSGEMDDAKPEKKKDRSKRRKNLFESLGKSATKLFEKATAITTGLSSETEKSQLVDKISGSYEEPIERRSEFVERRAGGTTEIAETESNPTSIRQPSKKTRSRRTSRGSWRNRLNFFRSGRTTESIKVGSESSTDESVVPEVEQESDQTEPSREGITRVPQSILVDRDRFIAEDHATTPEKPQTIINQRRSVLPVILLVDSFFKGRKLKKLKKQQKTQLKNQTRNFNELKTEYTSLKREVRQSRADMKEIHSRVASRPMTSPEESRQMNPRSNGLDEQVKGQFKVFKSLLERGVGDTRLNKEQSVAESFKTGPLEERRAEAAPADPETLQYQTNPEMSNEPKDYQISIKASAKTNSEYISTSYDKSGPISRKENDSLLKPSGSDRKSSSQDDVRVSALNALLLVGLLIVVALAIAELIG